MINIVFGNVIDQFVLMNCQSITLPLHWLKFHTFSYCKNFLFCYRRSSVSLLRLMVTAGMEQGKSNHYNFLNIQEAVLSRSAALIRYLLNFGLTDEKFYSYVYDILLAVIPMLRHGFDDILSNGEDIARFIASACFIFLYFDIGIVLCKSALTTIIRKSNYHKFLDFLLTQMSIDLSESSACFQLISWVSKSIEINPRNCFFIERFSYLFQKLLKTDADEIIAGQYVRDTLRILRIFLSQESAPHLKDFWTIIPAILVDLIHAKKYNDPTRREIFQFLAFAASHDAIRSTVRRALSQQELLQSLQMNQSDIIQSEKIPMEVLESMIQRLSYEMALYAALYYSDYNYPAVRSTSHPSSIDNLQYESPYEIEYITTYMELIRVILERLMDEKHKSLAIWQTTASIFSMISKYIDIHQIPSIEKDLLILSDCITTAIMNQFDSSVIRTKPANPIDESTDPSNRSASDDVLMTYQMIRILNIICGFQSLCWIMPSTFVLDDLESDVRLIDPQAASILLQDSDDLLLSARNDLKFRATTLQCNLTSTPNASNERSIRSLAYHSNTMRLSPLLARVHDRFLDYDLKQISSMTTAWFVEDMDFIESNPSMRNTPTTSMTSPSSCENMRKAMISSDQELSSLQSLEKESKMPMELKILQKAWKLLYIYICLRYIGLWRLIIADNLSGSAHGLDLSLVVESITNLLLNISSLKQKYDKKTIESEALSPWISSNDLQAILLTGFDILSLLLQYNKPSSIINQSIHHLSPVPADRSSYDIPSVVLSAPLAQSLHKLCYRLILEVWNDQKYNLYSYRSGNHNNVHDISLFYNLLSVIIALASQTSQNDIRREVIRNFGDFYHILISMDPFQSSIPLLLLIKSSIERINKLSDQNEEKLLILLLHGLRSSDKSIQICICDIIANISEVHPGLIYRIVGRPEIEDQLLFLLLSHRKYKAFESYYRQSNDNIFDKNAYYEPNQRSNNDFNHSIHRKIMEMSQNRQLSHQMSDIQTQWRQYNNELYLSQLYTLLRACTACIKDINPRPSWMCLASGFYYNWRIYIDGIQSRHLLHESIILIVIQKAIAIVSISQPNSVISSRTTSKSHIVPSNGNASISPTKKESLEKAAFIASTISQYSSETIADVHNLNGIDINPVSALQSPMITIVFAELLSFATALMYNCTDGVLASVSDRSNHSKPSKSQLIFEDNYMIRDSDGLPIQNISHPLVLKDELIMHIIPLLPRALDLVTMRETATTNEPTVIKTGNLSPIIQHATKHRSTSVSERSTKSDENVISLNAVYGNSFSTTNILSDSNRKNAFNGSINDSKTKQSPSRRSQPITTTTTMKDHHDNNVIRIQRSHSINTIISPASLSSPASLIGEDNDSIGKSNQQRKMSTDYRRILTSSVKSLNISNVFNRSKQSNEGNPVAMASGLSNRDNNLKKSSSIPSNPPPNASIPYDFQQSDDLDFDMMIISLESNLASSRSSAIRPNKALVLLTMKTLDALFAFLCLDEM